MSMTDPIADMLTRIRNALRIQNDKVRIPRSKVKVGIAEVLKSEGYINDFTLVDAQPQGWIDINLKYNSDGAHVINLIERVSKPGRRQYSGIEDLDPVLNGLGIYILSTPRGIISDRQARELKVGGELLAKIY